MAYTLKQLVEDCRAALTKDKGAIGRNAVRKFVELACLDDDFVSTYLGPENDTPRKVLYEDDELGFVFWFAWQRPKREELFPKEIERVAKVGFV